MWAKIERRLARVYPTRTVAMNNTKGLVTFTFDDAPQSACRTGRGLLEEKGARGTYYLSGSFYDEDGDDGPFYDRGDFLDLIEKGHEIACHGFGHLNYQTLTSDEIRNDIEKNRQFLRDLGLDLPTENFAYPYGCVSPRVKRLCGELFTSCRGVTPGINSKRLDPALLKSFPLYDSLWTREKLEDVMRETEACGGWSIFFTHAVIDRTTRYGSTPALMEHAVTAAANSGCDIVTVKEGLARIAGG